MAKFMVSFCLVSAGALGWAPAQAGAEEAVARLAAGAPQVTSAQQPAPAPIFIRPAGLPQDKPTGLFIFLHGSGSSPKECAPVLQSLAEAWQVSLFLPCGSRKCGIRPDGVSAYDWNPAQDVPEVLKAIQALKGIHAQGIFLMGFSSGAYMCYPLAFEQPSLFTGVIVFSGGLPGAYRDDGQLPAAAHKVPFFLVHGAQDTGVPMARAMEARQALTEKPLTGSTSNARPANLHPEYDTRRLA
ncbi:MAG: hypothetical protein NTV49_09510 [Kiritimatiellaeota bacterium]|nr:hypothetical protein [Kiritimatiellota bacterium]